MFYIYIILKLVQFFAFNVINTDIEIDKSFDFINSLFKLLKLSQIIELDKIQLARLFH